MKNVSLQTILVWNMIAIAAAVAVSQDKGEQRETGPKAVISSELRPLNALVGSWRGVGQIKRGSRSGAWTETVTCEWNFQDKNAAVILKSEGGQQFHQLKLTWDPKDQQVTLQQVLKETTRTYHGKMPDKWPGRMELESEPDKDGITYRCTIQQLNDIRSTLLFEKRATPTGSFRRIAGVGYTRAGEKLAVSGANKRKCIVTGGLGTIPVSYQGQTFYVCCQGCVQAFNDAPEAIIAEYRESLAAEKRKQK